MRPGESDRPLVALLAPVAADVVAALEDRFRLIQPGDIAILPEDARAAIRLGLTMAMAGAPACWTCCRGWRAW